MKRNEASEAASGTQRSKSKMVGGSFQDPAVCLMGLLCFSKETTVYITLINIF